MRFLIGALLVSIFCLNATADEVSKTFHFDNHRVVNTGEYQMVQFDGCLNTGHTGEPALPWFAVKLLLPPGEKAISFKVSGSNATGIPGKYTLYPQQSSRPISLGESGEFILDQKVYGSSADYPAEPYGTISTEYMNGHSIAMLNICPLVYSPAEGSLSYYTEMTVTVLTEADSKSSDALGMLKGTEAVRNRLYGFIQNPDMGKHYVYSDAKTDDYQLLIITPQAYENEFEQLMDIYLPRGLHSAVMSVEEIDNTISGLDLQDKIRNYIIQEYQAHSIEFVLLGGDVEHIPYRGFYCYVQSGSGYTDNDIPADLYYNALDGTWNDDNDNSWGEIGEDDLLPELAIGRFTFSNQDELDAMLNKTITYQESPILGEFRNPILVGEHLYNNPETWGADYMRLLIGYQDENGYTTIGIPPDQNIDSLYELHQNWGKSDILAEINEGKSFVHHCGHANSTYVMALSNSDITNANFASVNGSTHNYTFFQTHGCICGAFDASDCIMERMLAIDNFAAAVIGNSRYGWFNEGQTEGPAAHLHREMVDALYEEQMGRIGAAFMECKIQTAPWVNAPGQHEEGALRWNFYDINILGDPAIQLWTDEPFNVNATFNAPIFFGDTVFEVSVSNAGTPVEGLSCTLIRDTVFHGSAVTDSNGVATISINPVFNTAGPAQLTISGYNCLTTVYNVAVAPAGSPYILYENYILDDTAGGNANGLPEYSESILMTVELNNAGTADATNVTATLSSTSALILITDNYGEYGNIPSGGTAATTNDFAFNIDDFVPDQSIVEFEMNITDGTENWTESFSIVLNAPVLDIGEMTIDDEQGGNGDGFLDPGETADLIFEILNNGHSDALEPQVNCSIVSQGNYVIPGYSINYLDTLKPGIVQYTIFDVSVKEDAELGSWVSIGPLAEAGPYSSGKMFDTQIGLMVEDWESGGFDTYNWQFEADAPWTMCVEDPYEEDYCAKSGDIGNGQSSELYLYTEILADGEMSFYRKLSSEAEYDYLKFYIDNTLMGEWSGELNWEQVSYPVDMGLHTFRWVYEKDNYSSSGEDCAWVDFIVLPPFDITTGIITYGSGIDEITMRIIPNPASNNVNIEYTLEDESGIEMSIFDLAGHEVMNVVKNDLHQSGTFSHRIDISGLKPGLYLCSLKTAYGNISQKLIIQ